MTTNKTTIDEFVTRVKNNTPLVYEKGVEEGIGEAITAHEEFLADKPKTYYDTFWDVLQRNGEESGSNYYYAFTYNQFNDDTYKPKYDIICSTGTRPAQCLFYNNTLITDTKVPIVVKGASAASMFYGASNLVTVRKLTLQENVVLTSIFSECTSLENLTIDGTIGNSVDIKDSPLTKKSIESVIEHLSGTKSGLTVTLSQTAVNNAFTEDEWSALEATKSNWTISLV